MAKTKIRHKKRYLKRSTDMISSAERSEVHNYVRAGIEERKRIRNSASLTLNDGIKLKPKLWISKGSIIIGTPRLKQYSD